MNKYLEYILYESDVEPVGLPEGVNFLLAKELKKIEEVEKKLSELFEMNGFKKVSPPVFEYYETFEKGGGIDVARRSFSFKDKDGKLLSLRFDMTTPIARMVSIRYTPKDLPLYFYYTGDVFREQPFHKGKRRQIRQVGIEIIGDDSVETDIKVIELFYNAVSILSEDYVVVLGDVRIYRTFLNFLPLSDSKKIAIASVFNKKDRSSLEILLDEVECGEYLKQDFMALMEITGNLDDIRKNAKLIGIKEVRKILDEFLAMVEKLPADIKEKVIIDLGLIKDFSYYSSLVMEGYSKNVGYAIGGGGRYDDLFNKFGCDYPAIGFAVQI